MFLSKGPVSSVSLVGVPLHLSFSMLHIIFILPVVNKSFFPIKLSQTFHLALNPVSNVKITFGPLIHSFAVELISNELPYIFLKKISLDYLLVFDVLHKVFIDKGKAIHFPR